MHFVYFIQSVRNSKIYVGSTNKDPNTRLKEHNSSSNTWTKSNGPFKLIYYESFHCQTCAKSRELFYKTGLGRKIRNAILSALGKSSVSAMGGSASG